MVRSLLATLLVAPAALALAAPAAADEAEYLELRERLVFLTADQLLTEGRRVCQATANGMGASDIVGMVRRDLGASSAAATDIVTTAIIELDC
jgi:hypothetical protein